MNAERTIESADGFSITPKMLSIMRHTIGYDDAGNDRFPSARSLDERRNHFVTSVDHEDGKNCVALTAMGYMQDHGPQSMMRGDHVFTVTDEGRAVVLQHRPKPLTASQQRYRRFLSADSGLKFIEWLKRDAHYNKHGYA